MPDDQPVSHMTPYIQKEIPKTEPVSFFGQKNLPTPKKTTQDFYREYNETMDRLLDGIEAQQAKQAAPTSKD